MSRIHEGKRLTNARGIIPIQPPGRVYIPIACGAGAPSRPVVQEGDLVKKGQLIAQAGGCVSAPIHASVSGRIVGLEERIHVSGNRMTHIVIENDFQEEWAKEVQPRGEQEIAALSPKDIRSIIEESGIVGMGGAAFPTHVKLSIPEGKQVDTLLINGAECEPYAACDDVTMQEYAGQIMKGIQLIMRAIGVSRAVVGIEDNKPEAIAKMEAAAGMTQGVEIRRLRTRYPQGSEKQLIQSILKRQVPQGGLPMDAGAVVSNVGTCYAIYEAVYLGRPLVERTVTVTGAVNKPQNFRMPIGTTFEYAIECAGGFLGNPGKLIVGGPMMGFAQFTDEVSVIKGTTGILVLDEKQAKDPEEIACVRCGRCVTACPVGLMPLMLDEYSRARDYDRMKEYHILDCIECGCCSYICPSKRYLVQSIRTGKNELRKLPKEEA